MKKRWNLKISSKLLRIGLAALFILKAVPWAHGNGEGNGGGSLIKDKAGNYYPADLDMSQKMDQLPYPSSARINLVQQMPELYKKLQVLIGFLELRSNGHIKLNQTQFDFYATKSFSGEDKVSIEDPSKLTQVAFTYRFVEGRDQNYSEHKVVELGPLFFKQNTRIQALIILHEMLHHQKNGIHSKIAPVIAALFQALPGLELQLEQKNYSPISEIVWQGLVKLDSALADFTEIAFEEERIIDKNGGGVIIAYGNKDITASQIANSNNYVSLNSRIYLRLGSDKATDFENNTFIDSKVRIQAIKNCRNNKITSNRSTLRCEVSNSVLNKVYSIGVDFDSSEPSTLILKGREIELNKLSYHGDIVLEGANKLLDVVLSSGNGNYGVTLQTGIGFQRSRIKLNSLRKGIQIGFSKARNYPVLIEELNLVLNSDFNSSPATLKLLVASIERTIKFDLCIEHEIDLTSLHFQLPWSRNPIINLKNADQLAKELPHGHTGRCSGLASDWVF